MRRRSVVAGLALGPALIGEASATPTKRAGSRVATPVLDSLAMPVTAAENRQYSFTDKQSAYFHGRTHTDENPDWFNGWNIATKRIFHDYALSVDGVALSRADAQAAVSPHKLVRRYGQGVETLSLLDGIAVLVVGLSEVRGAEMGFALKGDLTDTGQVGPEGIWFAPKEVAGTQLLIAPIVQQSVRYDARLGVVTASAAQGFYIIHAATKPAARALLSRVRRGASAMLAARARRMEALVSGNLALDAGDPDRTKALLWMRLTADQLVMKQMGTGIYAGLPWFNDYWGRDTFISITGTLFVTGQYDIAADVFRSFAALQDVREGSKTYGRVPNRARPDGVEYNSADGTPRFIITLADLVQRSGNVALARELWPAVKRAVEGVLANNVDEFGLITHDDADTWMDAKEKGVRAWSPRGNRAVDVQALWLEAFGAVLQLLALQSEQTKALLSPKVSEGRSKLESGLAQFIDPSNGYLVDHLRPDGSRDTKLRPNVLFAMQIVTLLGPMRAQQQLMQLRSVWEELVYPWGVATLSQNDPDFYPYHEHWHYYHKDAAYHNGTVWPWLNGIAIQRMVESDQVELAWQLFENMNRQALHEGAVGSLAECADALPIEVASWTRRTGTFLQAWSNAEQLRVWQECFLGVKNVSLSESALTTPAVDIRPRLPTSIKDVRCSFLLQNGTLSGHYNVSGQPKWRFSWRGGSEVVISMNMLGAADMSHMISLYSGDSVEFSVKNGKPSLRLQRKSRVVEIDDLTEGFLPIEIKETGSAQTAVIAKATPTQLREMERRIFAGLEFCQPKLNPGLKSLSVRHDPPLTY